MLTNNIVQFLLLYIYLLLFLIFFGDLFINQKVERLETIHNFIIIIIIILTSFQFRPSSELIFINNFNFSFTLCAFKGWYVFSLDCLDI